MNTTKMDTICRVVLIWKKICASFLTMLIQLSSYFKCSILAYIVMNYTFNINFAKIVLRYIQAQSLIDLCRKITNFTIQIYQELKWHISALKITNYRTRPVLRNASSTGQLHSGLNSTKTPHTVPSGWLTVLKQWANRSAQYAKR